MYASSTLALAAIEYLIHIDVEDVPLDLVSLAIDLLDGASQAELRAEDLADGWRAVPAPSGCKAIGDDWATNNETLLLRVPSILIPEESNVLLNPRHPGARRVNVVSMRPFTFDPRRFGRR